MEETKKSKKISNLLLAAILAAVAVLIPLVLLISLIGIRQFRPAEIEGKGYNTHRTIATPFICSYSRHFTSPLTEEYCGYAEFLRMQSGEVWFVITIFTVSGVLPVYLLLSGCIIAFIVLFRNHKNKKSPVSVDP